MADAMIWSKRVAAWRASGQTAAEYSARHGIGLSALRYWSQKTRREQVAGAATPTVRLARVERIPTVADATELAPAPILIELGRARILVGRGVDRATLATVLGVLGAGTDR